MPKQSYRRSSADRIVIGISGRIGAGKTSIGKYLSSAHGFHYTRYSQVLSDWQAQDPESKTRLQAVGWEVMAGGMQQELNARLISQLPSGIDCAVDGLRHPLDFENLDRTFTPNFHLVFVKSPSLARWVRLQARYPAREDFDRADSHPVEQCIDSLCERAFAVLENEGSLQSLYTKLDEALQRIQGGGTR